jgi:nicotinate-nucleotide adenylyltransferase
MRIGVLGGTFNPIHNGHLHIARSVQKLFSLYQVHFVVATTPPHKSCKDLIPFTHRYAMVSLALAEEPAFIPSPVELEPKASPFSIDTMRKIGRKIDKDRCALYFIAGGDSLLEVKTWRESEKLLNTYNFVFVARPGTTSPMPADVLPESAAARVRDLTGIRRVQMLRQIAEKDVSENRIYIVNIGAPDISATRIRSLASSGESVRRMVPRPVGEYIRKLHLYGGR